MKMHTYIAQFAYDHGNGWAVINSPSPGYIEGTLKRQSRFQNITLTSCKEIEYFGNETSLMCEGGVTTLDKSPYDIAVENGFAGSETEWLESLKGENGKDATINGVSTLVIEAGEGISIQQINGRLVLNVTGGDYDGVKNKPSINSHKLEGNKSSEELGLQDKLTFDTTPVQDSNKPITSGGVFSALNTLITNSSLFGGVVGPSDQIPYGDDHRYFYLASQYGSYSNFNPDIYLDETSLVMLYWNGGNESWQPLYLSITPFGLREVLQNYLKRDSLNEELGFQVFLNITNYLAGDVVIYEGGLYQFTTNHAAGPWIGTDAQGITVVEYINSH